MDKLQMCRICLAEDVRMYVVVNKNLRELYEKMTDIPFVTADRRPILACFFCCAKLKQCFRLMRKCLEAEELFAQILIEDYEPNPLINPDHIEFFSGFVKSPVVLTSTDDECQTGSIVIKEELPADCYELENIIEPKEESLSNEDIGPENADNSYLDVEDIPPDHSESDSEGDVPLMEFKVEVEEAIEVPKMKRRAAETNSACFTRRIKPEDTNTVNKPSNLKVFRTTRNRTSKPGSCFEEPDECDDQRIRKKTYKCDVCRRSFNSKCQLKTHIRVHTGEKPYKCDICQRSFSQSNHLTKHIRIHTGDKPYKCDVCQSSFSEAGSLTKHIRTHIGEKPFKCDVCQRSFNSKCQLKTHIRVHTGEKPYKCDICQRSFSQSNHLTKHIRIHTGDKPYKCDVCQRSFSEAGSLKKHIRTHTGEKPFKCDVCQRSFTESGGLRNHFRIHSGERPFKCDVCQRGFSEKSSLTKHFRTHTGEKPYKCDVCQRSFSQKSQCTTHAKTHW